MSLSIGLLQSYAKTEAPKRVTDRKIGSLIRRRKSSGIIVNEMLISLWPSNARSEYQRAVRYKLKFHQRWRETAVIGIDWLNTSLKRNSSLVYVVQRQILIPFSFDLSTVLDKNKFETHNV